MVLRGWSDQTRNAEWDDEKVNEKADGKAYEKVNEKADGEAYEKAHLKLERSGSNDCTIRPERLGLTAMAWTVGLNEKAQTIRLKGSGPNDKARRLDMSRINSWTNPVSIC